MAPRLLYLNILSFHDSAILLQCGNKPFLSCAPNWFSSSSAVDPACLYPPPPTAPLPPSHLLAAAEHRAYVWQSLLLFLTTTHPYRAACTGCCLVNMSSPLTLWMTFHSCLGVRITSASIWVQIFLNCSFFCLLYFLLLLFYFAIEAVTNCINPLDI